MKREISFFSSPVFFAALCLAAQQTSFASSAILLLRRENFCSLPPPSVPFPLPLGDSKRNIKPKGCKNRRRGKEGLCFCGVGKYFAYLFGGYFVGVSTCFSSLLLQPPLQLQYKFGYKNLFTLLPCYPRYQFERFFHGAWSQTRHLSPLHLRQANHLQMMRQGGRGKGGGA